MLFIPGSAAFSAARLGKRLHRVRAGNPGVRDLAAGFIHFVDVMNPLDAGHMQVLQRVFQFDVELGRGEQLDHFGQRVFVRFEHEMQPLSVQWYRSIRLLFLTTFNV